MEIDTGIPPAQRAAIVQGLSRMLADTYMVYLKTHSFHWNVEGPMFQTLHQMFMEQYTETWNAIDPSPSASARWANTPPAPTRSTRSLARVKETDGVPRAEDMVRLLIEGQEAIVRTAREVLPVADEAQRRADARSAHPAHGGPREERVDAAQPAEEVRWRPR